MEKLDTLFAFPEVEAVRWEQYTPYFNDGDVCVFNIHDAYIKFVGVDEGGECEDGFGDGKAYPDGYWATHYNKHSHGIGSYQKPVPAGKIPHDYKDQRFFVNGAVREDISAAFTAVARAITSEIHADDFLDVFGDPAQVTATRAGFDVEHYDHD